VVEAAEEALELRVRGAGILGLRVGAHRRLRWRLPEGGRIEGTAGGGQFAGAEDGEGAVRWGGGQQGRRRSSSLAVAARLEEEEEGRRNWARPTASHSPRRGVRPRVDIDQGGGQEDPPKAPHHIARV
jgi:hypothetical protein